MPVSFKINGNVVDPNGWRDVPMWITTGSRPFERRMTSSSPTVVVQMPRMAPYTSTFLNTVSVVNELLADMDVDFESVRWSRPLSPSYRQLRKHLQDFQNRPLAEGLDHLRQSAAHGVLGIFGDLTNLESATITIPTLDNAVIRKAFTADALERIHVLQSHLWVPSTVAA